ncbi:MAG TPA: multidrug effflux MFS transporter [Pyrinomonadaceae bacterium]|jgi:DHA1 family bicyclomycin/chloramphenicol resistance-like MFS transporter
MSASKVIERSPGLLTLLLAALTGLTSLSIDMSLPAMPQLQQTFNAGISAVQLTLSIFLAGFALGQIICGPLSDRWGRRPVLLAGLALFTLAGFVCAGSDSLPMLLAARFVQGAGASVGPVVARAIVRDRFDSRRAAAVLSQMTQVMIIAPLLAPTLGGYLLVHMGWPAIFFVLGGSGALMCLICWRCLPETAAGRKAATDKVSAEGRADEVSAQARGGLREVLSHRASLRHALTTCFAYAGMFAYVGSSPFVLMDGFGVTEQNFGYVFALTAAALLVSATVNRSLLKRHTSSLLILRRGVVTIFAAGLALVLAAWLGVGGLAGVLLPMMAYMFGQGLVMPNATAAAMAPHGASAGVISSFMGALQTAGGALAGYLVGAFYDHTSLSLAVTVAAFATMTLLASGLARPGRAGVTEGRSTALHVTCDA